MSQIEQLRAELSQAKAFTPRETNSVLPQQISASRSKKQISTTQGVISSIAKAPTIQVSSMITSKGQQVRLKGATRDL